MPISSPQFLSPPFNNVVIGAAGTVLTSNGPTVAPTFQAGGGGGTPAGPSTAIQFNNGGAFAGTANLTWTDATGVLQIGGDNAAGGTLTSGTPGAGNPGRGLLITATSSNLVTGGGGSFQMVAGNGGSTSGAGGLFSIVAGSAPGTGAANSNGGQITFTGGAGAHVNGSGGAVVITGGAARCTGTGDGGSLTIQCGAASAVGSTSNGGTLALMSCRGGGSVTGNGGPITITAGDGAGAAATGNGGAITISSGNGGAGATGLGGAITIVCGTGNGTVTGSGSNLSMYAGDSATLGNGGNVLISGGQAIGTGTNGNIQFQNAYNTVVTVDANGFIGGLASYFNFTTVGNVANTQTDAYSHTTVPGILSVNGQSIEFSACGTFANTASVNKRVTAQFGATTIFDSGNLAITTASSWAMLAKIMRTGANTQKAWVTFTTSSGSVLQSTASYTTPGETLANAITVKLTLNGTNASDSVAQFIKEVTIR